MIHTFYAGCYTEDPKDKGIHLLRFDASSGELSHGASYYGGESPSFLIRAGNFLYAANEIGNAGKLSALLVGADKALAYLNSVEISGAHTCHIAEMNGYLYAANYSSGNIFGVEILAGGSLGKVVAEVQHKGFGPNLNRQSAPHAHSVNPVPGDNLLIAADLGADKLFCYRQQEDGALAPDAINPAIIAPAGGGPRHMAFHPDGNRFFAVMEMGVSLVCYIKTEDGWRLESDYPLLTGTFTEADTAADIHFAANGTRLYVSIRGKNLISAFQIGADGVPGLIGSYPTFGDSPRNFCFSPDERFVIIAHQASGHVTVCPVDANTGVVGEMLSSIILSGASCVINA